MRVAKTTKCRGSGCPRSRELTSRLRARWSSLRRDELARGRRSAVQSPALGCERGLGVWRSKIRRPRRPWQQERPRGKIRDPRSGVQVPARRHGAACVRGPRSGTGGPGRARRRQGQRPRSKTRWRPAGGRRWPLAVQDPPSEVASGAGEWASVRDPRSARTGRGGQRRVSKVRGPAEGRQGEGRRRRSVPPPSSFIIDNGYIRHPGPHGPVGRQDPPSLCDPRAGLYELMSDPLR